MDKWLAELSKKHSTRTLRLLLSVVRRSIKFAQARDKVKRNVAMLAECPAGQPGRPSKSLTVDQAEAVLIAAENDGSTVGDYIVTSLLSGGRTEEIRALRVSDVHFRDEDDETSHTHIDVFRSVRTGGGTKTKKSHRSLAIASRGDQALKRQMVRREAMRNDAGKTWRETGVLFASLVGTELDRHNVLRAFRRILCAAGLDGAKWTPRELRHSFVSLLSDAKVPIEVISRLVGHSGTAITETVYRHQIRPVVEEAATAMNRILPGNETT